MSADDRSPVLTALANATAGALGASPTPHEARIRAHRFDGPNCERSTPRGQIRTPEKPWSSNIVFVELDGHSVSSVLRA